MPTSTSTPIWVGFAAELDQWNYSGYGYHDHREFESETSWKGALEAFAEGYHFPFVHGQSVIGQNTVANTHVYDEWGRHHRIGFPFNNIADLNDDPSQDWDPVLRMGVIYWIYPNLILANSPVGCRGHRHPARGLDPTSVHGAAQLDGPATRPPTTHSAPSTTRSTTRCTPRCVTRTSSCCRSAARACATASTTT